MWTKNMQPLNSHSLTHQRESLLYMSSAFASDLVTENWHSRPHVMGLSMPTVSLVYKYTQQNGIYALGLGALVCVLPWQCFVKHTIVTVWVMLLLMHRTLAYCDSLFNIFTSHFLHHLLVSVFWPVSSLFFFSVFWIVGDTVVVKLWFIMNARKLLILVGPT